MAKTQIHHGKEIIYLDKSDIAVTMLRCPRCGGTVAVKTFENKATLKCKCQIFFVYPESYLQGRGSVITLQEHKERLKEIDQKKVDKKEIQE